jgi:hypothetical protein
LFVLLITGCSSSSNPSRISGKVTYKDKLVTGGTITFLHKDGGTFTYRIGADGTYSGSELPIGEMTVTVETESVNPSPPAMKGSYAQGKDQQGGDPNDYKKMMQQKGAVPEDGGKPKGEYVPIPLKYADPKTSDLRVTLTGGKNKKDFELTD